MPAYAGLRSRPHVGLSRASLRANLRGRISQRREHVGAWLSRLPATVFAPLVIIAGLAAGYAVHWTHALHDEATAFVDDPNVTTGTLPTATR